MSNGTKETSSSKEEKSPECLECTLPEDDPIHDEHSWDYDHEFIPPRKFELDPSAAANSGNPS